VYERFMSNDSAALAQQLTAGLEDLVPGLYDVYRDLHAHPELSMAEYRTAGIVAEGLRAQGGWEVTEGVGVTGVVGVLRNGEGPTVLLRADMDALPVREDTGFPHASTDTAVNPDGETVYTMHACGHDIHTTCLLGATRLLADHRDSWSGTVVAVFQPGEETAAGARAMLDDGFLDRFPRPDVSLGQHVGPQPTGVVAARPGPVMAAADSFRIRLFGRGGHGSSPQQTVDPVVMAASTVLRLQGVVSREIAATDSAVVTVGSLRAGSKENIIPDEAELKVNVRSFDPDVREKVLASIKRIVDGEAQVSGAPKDPEFSPLNAFPLTVNSDQATAEVMAALGAQQGIHVHEMRHPLPGSEDFGAFGTAAGCPSVFWFFGGSDPELWENSTEGEKDNLPEGVAGNHSPHFAPRADPAVPQGVRHLLHAAAVWLAKG
jgi:hippurate hydrolase